MELAKGIYAEDGRLCIWEPLLSTNLYKFTIEVQGVIDLTTEELESLYLKFLLLNSKKILGTLNNTAQL